MLLSTRVAHHHHHHVEEIYSSSSSSSPSSSSFFFFLIHRDKNMKVYSILRLDLLLPYHLTCLERLLPHTRILYVYRERESTYQSIRPQSPSSFQRLPVQLLLLLLVYSKNTHTYMMNIYNNDTVSRIY